MASVFLANNKIVLNLSTGTGWRTKRPQSHLPSLCTIQSLGRTLDVRFLNTITVADLGTDICSLSSYFCRQLSDAPRCTFALQRRDPIGSHLGRLKCCFQRSDAAPGTEIEAVFVIVGEL
jgi:hypothetical protein